MDERLDYGNQEDLKQETSKWMLNRGKGSGTSLEADKSKLLLQYKNYHIHLVKDRDDVADRPTIPASKHEKLAFYRNYCVTQKKLEMDNSDMISINGFIWYYILNVVFKSLNHTFVQVFLASYTPHEHLFVSKMVPFFYGFKAVILFTTFFEISFYAHDNTFAVLYLLIGIMYKNPWNRCTGNHTIKDNITITCYNSEDFARRVTNETMFENYYYVSPEGENFQIAQVDYYKYFAHIWSKNTKLLCFVLLWCLTICWPFHERKTFWRVYNIIHILELSMEIMVALFLILNSFNEVEEEVSECLVAEINDTNTKWTSILDYGDVTFLAESTTAPPVVHFLSAKSSNEIVASSESAEIVFSNAAFYIFRFVMVTKLLQYICSHVTKMHIRTEIYNPQGFYFIWPLFFSAFFMGDILTLLFFALNMTNELLTTIVIYNCFIDVIMNEWPQIKRRRLVVSVSVLLIAVYHFCDYNIIILIAIFSKVLATLGEVVIIYYFYPVGRLVDDITFHYGMEPTTLRVLGLQVMPVFYLIKTYILIVNTNKLVMASGPTKLVKYALWSWTIPVALIILGSIVTSWNYIVRKKMSWARMFVPDDDWGPEDLEVRALRKVYDSRFYIASQAMRSLSRYMIKKRENDAYQLDLNYIRSRRSTVLATSRYHMEAEKKAA